MSENRVALVNSHTESIHKILQRMAALEKRVRALEKKHSPVYAVPPVRPII